MALTKGTSSMVTHPFDWVEGTAIASAATINLNTATGEVVHITGTTTITAITLSQGLRLLMFDGILTLTNSASLICQGAANIVTAAGDTVFAFGEGAGVTRLIGYTRTAVAPNSGAFSNALVHVREEQVSGTDGGTFTSGARRTRVLNTVKTNEISGVVLAADQLTVVPAGTYYCEFMCPAAYANNHKAYLRNITAGTDLIVGKSEFSSTSDSGSGSGRAVTHSVGRGRFTLAATSTLELQHRCSVTVATFGFGDACSFSPDVEVYSELLIWKLT